MTDKKISDLTSLTSGQIANDDVIVVNDTSTTTTKKTTVSEFQTFLNVSASDVVNDTTPQLGGTLDTNGKLIQFGDSSGATDDRLQFGASQDLSLYHDGSNTHIKNTNGDFYIASEGGSDLYLRSDDDVFIQSQGGEHGVKVVGNGAVELYFDNNKKFETYASGTKNAGNLWLTQDNGKGLFGANTDLQIFHDATDNIINNHSADLHIKHGSEFQAKFIQDGAVELYYNNVKKAETTSSGFNLPSGGSALQWQNGYQTITGASNSNDLTYRTYATHIWKNNTGASSTTDGTEVMRIASDGDIGIGTTDPTQNLELVVSKTASIPTDASVGSTSNGSACGMGIHNENNSAVYSGLNFETRTTHASRWLMGNEWKSSYNGDLFFRARDGASSSSEILRLKSDGNVGIGTASPNNYSGYTTLTINNATNGGIIDFEANGTLTGEIYSDNTGLGFQTPQADDDIFFKGNDGGSTITALTLDMSDSGMAHFNNYIKVADRVVGSSNLILTSTDANEKIQLDASGYMKFETNGGERVRIDSSGKVGIGVTNPAVTMELSGNGGAIRLPTGGELQFGNANNFILGNSGNNYLAFTTNSSERVRIDSSGNVGIGTTSPNRTLSVYGNAQLDGVATASPQLAFRQNGTDKAYLTYWDSSDTLALTDGSANGLHFSPSTGSVGIGTSSPNQLLTVVKGQNSDTAIRVANGTGGTSARASLFLDVDSGGAQLMAIDDGFSTSGVYIADGVTFVSDTAMHNGMTIGTRSSNSGAHLRFYTQDSERMRISGNGNVGIGTSSPGRTLSVDGDGIIGLQGSQNAIAFTESSSLKAYITSGAFGDHNGDGLGLVTSGNEPIKFFANGGEKMRIDSTGAVTMPLQPAFQVRPSSDQSVSPSSWFTVAFGTEIFDQNADFSSNTFTAPVTGKYFLTTSIRIDAVDEQASYYWCRIITSNRDVYGSLYDLDGLNADPDYWYLTASALCDMDAGDTATVSFLQNLGTTQVHIDGSATAFSGYLVC
jgi:hypothetical protein